MALLDIDRRLLQNCLERGARSWEDFVDRFMGLVVHVVHHTAQARSVRLRPEDRDDLCAEVFLHFIKDDFAVLRHFRGNSSLATYLTVVARRVVVKEILRRRLTSRVNDQPQTEVTDSAAPVEQRIDDRDQVERLLTLLEGNEAEVIRLFHLDGKTYREISELLGVPENTIGPTLSRARAKLRSASVSDVESPAR